MDDSKSLAQQVEELTAEVRSLKFELAKLNRIVVDDIEARRQAAQTERWKELVPESRKYLK